MNTDDLEYVRPSKNDRIKARLGQVHPERVIRLDEPLHVRVVRLILNVHTGENTSNVMPDTLSDTNCPSGSDKQHYFQHLAAISYGFRYTRHDLVRPDNRLTGTGFASQETYL